MLRSCLRGIVHLILKVFFRRLHVVGAERVPLNQPLVVVANHVNGLIDPALVFALFPRRSRFLAKSTLWRIWPLRPLLAVAGALPVYRRQDAGVDPTRNRETFEACYHVLGRGGVVALFPEGTSHDEPYLLPLKTGAARIALEAQERSSGVDVAVLPVGLVFGAKERFRSRVLMHIGEPIAVGPGGAQPELVSELTELIDERLRAVTLSYDSWEEAQLLEQAAALYDDRWGPGPTDLCRAFPLRQSFSSGYTTLKDAFPERVRNVAAAVEAYQHLLAHLSLEDRHLAVVEVSLPSALRYLLRRLLLLFFTLPLAVLGTALNWLPYRIPGCIAGRLARGREVEATYKVLSALLAFPLVWISEAFLGAIFGGPWAGALVLLLAPLSGYVALVFHEARRELSTRLSAYLLLHGRRRLFLEVHRHRRAVCVQVEELVGLFESMKAAHSAATQPREPT